MAYTITIEGENFDFDAWEARVIGIIESGAVGKLMRLSAEYIAEEGGLFPDGHVLLDGSIRGVWLHDMDTGALIDVPTFASQADWNFAFAAVRAAYACGADVEDEGELLGDLTAADCVAACRKWWIDSLGDGEDIADGFTLQIGGGAFEVRVEKSLVNMPMEQLMPALANQVRHFAGASPCAVMMVPHEDTTKLVSSWDLKPSLLAKETGGIYFLPEGLGLPWEPILVSLADFLQVMEGEFTDVGNRWYVKAQDTDNLQTKQKLTKLAACQCTMGALPDAPEDYYTGFDDDDEEDSDEEDDDDDDWGADEPDDDAENLLLEASAAPVCLFLALNEDTHFDNAENAWKKFHELMHSEQDRETRLPMFRIAIQEFLTDPDRVIAAAVSIQLDEESMFLRIRDAIEELLGKPQDVLRFKQNLIALGRRLAKQLDSVPEQVIKQRLAAIELDLGM